MEIYNHGCAVSGDPPHGFYTLDQLLSAGRRLSLCATDDAHFAGPDHFGRWMMVKTRENDPLALTESLKDGDFYSSTGPDFRAVHVEETRVVVACSAVSTVIVQGRGSAAVAVHGTSMTRAEVPTRRLEGSPWLRSTIIDSAGKRA